MKRKLKCLMVVLLAALLVCGLSFAAWGADVEDKANADISVKGTVSGSYTDTHTSNDVYESITEISTLGKPSGRYSYLEHKWTIDVTGGDTVTFYVEAYHTTNSEGDDFIFAYSTDDSDYTNMVTVTKVSDDDTCQDYSLPDSTSGTVYIRVVDTDRTGGNTSLDTIYVDHMYTLSTGALPPPVKITLTTDMVTNETVQGDAGMLVDEQGIAGDPPVNDVYTNWSLVDSPNEYFTGYLPMNATIDLGGTYTITDVYLYDARGMCDYTVSYGEPFNWTTLFVDDLGSYLVWHHEEISPTVQTRYLRVEKPERNIGMHEIVVYGTLVEAAPTPTPSPTPTQFGFAVEETMGTNAFINDAYAKIDVVKLEREYHFWCWDETGDPAFPNNENEWQPSNAELWYFDTYYGDLSTTYGITINMCLQKDINYTTDKPIDDIEDPLDPASYIEHADHMYQYAARYGSVEVNDNYLKLASGQPRETGLDYLKYYENWNEHDRYWDGLKGYFKPYEYAAMSTADCDGDEDALGTTIGLKNADPDAKLVMSGQANPDNPNYINALKFWCDWNRSDGKFIFDAVNIHVYCSDGDRGISPEADDLKGRMEEFVAYRDVELPGVEVWLTEFGWDTCQNAYRGKKSYVRAIPIGSYDEFEVQAQWIIRGYLACLAAGVDRAFQYMLRDVDSESGTPFNSSGLVAEPPTCTPKVSWYYVYTMRNRLTGMEYLSEQDSGNSDVWIYKFEAQGGNDGAYVLWCPTEAGTTVDNYELTLTGSPSTATLVEMVDEDTDGVETSLTISNGKVTVDVSEQPIFVLVNDI